MLYVLLMMYKLVEIQQNDKAEILMSFSTMKFENMRVSIGFVFTVQEIKTMTFYFMK